MPVYRVHTNSVVNRDMVFKNKYMKILVVVRFSLCIGAAVCLKSQISRPVSNEWFSMDRGPFIYGYLSIKVNLYTLLPVIF